ncbi:ABC transporter permease [Brucella sp. ZJ1_1]|uniref:Binding-protein-dependent transport systems inner membrane component n=3 Tax=Brucella intermedia TaxID=94625 RepID=C4WNL5_9HYPH|nr:ABC transporter permease [Brucella intermedia]ERI13616.1 ABC transporter permease [Ochrobactrum sp. EGD-AQ16]EEQ93970.1 binding-protein-dependent transport systems inner membrane component [Brucella intermedia LMG 3301]ELT50763.1 binding-protein-dependent transport system inner membrane protein [Brucella intermedia M86]KAB2694454.1 ABC transporter permease [Brucella intermedia]MDH0125520.1 ABC transporter permease [Brucella intermedia GD04153]
MYPAIVKQILALFRKRLAGSIIVLLIVIVGCFFMLESAPGDAVDAYAVTFGGDAATIAEMRARWGLDQSIWHRLGAYLAALAQGNLGWSVSFNRPILDVILERLPNTLLLMGAATALSFAVGSLLGIVAGARPGSFRDRLLSVASLVLYAIPGFWLALVLVILFSIRLRWLPSSGIETIASGKQGLARAGDIAVHLVLPVVSLAVIYLALYLRVMRAAMADIWRMDFVRALRARGISHSRIVLRHVVRNALLPLVTVLGLQAASMLGGSVVIESVFAVPGLGRLAQEAVASRDTPLLLGVILVSAIMVIVVNFLIDLVYLWLDPRIARGDGRA